MFINNEVGYYKINYYIIKTIKKTKTNINLTKQKKPFLVIINNLYNKLKNSNKISKNNFMKNKINIYYPLFLPFYIKHSYFKKNIKY